ncbi:MAG: hypothetical protein IKW88_03180 [Clostridiales bacterium]|nr:hypothetical protein [Clostridiales bacterium]
MKVFLSKDLSNLPMYGDVPDLSQETNSVESFEITDDELDLINEFFIDPTNELCDAALDLGDYQYYNDSQCALLLDWLNKVSNEDHMIPLRNFFNKLESYLQYAVANNTGIAIEL